MCNRHPPSLPPHPVYVSWLPGIIIRVRPSWTWWVVVEVTAPAPYFAPKIWVKMAKLGANLDRSVWMGGCTNLTKIWTTRPRPAFGRLGLGGSSGGKSSYKTSPKPSPTACQEGVIQHRHQRGAPIDLLDV